MRRETPVRLARFVAALLVATLSVRAGHAGEDPASSLRARYVELASRMGQSALPQHLYLESIEGPALSRGEVYALVDYPVETVASAFASAPHWCEALILHLNVKYCRPDLRGPQPILSVAIGRKREEPLASAFRVEFRYTLAVARPDYLQVVLAAPEGPLGTGNYRIVLEAVRLADARTLVRLTYSYSYGLQARLALGAYLATTGAGKVGFTRLGDPAASPPQFVGGIRGAIERNTMRYYLAIDAYLATLGVPADERFEESLTRWFAGTERYARQLHEIDREAYLAMKRSEHTRQEADH